jgi:hypothetical protein
MVYVRGRRKSISNLITDEVVHVATVALTRKSTLS